MKKHINNKVYDTETSIFLAHAGNDLPPKDPNFLSEDLYRKRTGEFFVHVKGGVDTVYAKRKGGERTPGENILPLVYNQAQNWAKDHLSEADFQKVFGEAQDSDGFTILGAKISAKAHESLKQLASKSGKSISAYVNDLILKAYEDQK